MIVLFAGIPTGKAVAQSGEDFKPFLDKFTSSAAFQYTRIKFPLKTPITLLADDGETEKTFPFTKEKWPLLDSETMKKNVSRKKRGEFMFPNSH